MHHRIPAILFALFCVFTAHARAADAPAPAPVLLQDFGTYTFQDSGVTIALTEVSPAGLGVRMTFAETFTPSETPGAGLVKTGAASTGTGAGSSIAVVPGRWAAQFVPPHQLWIYDGASAIKLYERTTVPKGFKASSSTLVPDLLTRAPQELRALINNAGR